MKIVVRIPNWVGDAILARPALDSLAAHFPGAEIVVAAADWVRDLFGREEGGPRVLTLDGKGSADALRAEAFDLGLLFTNSFGTALQFRKAGIPERWGYRRDGRGFLLTKGVKPPDSQAEPRHHIHYYLDLLNKLGLPTLEPELRFRLAPNERREAKALLRAQGAGDGRPLVVLNPGASYGPAKRWPAERFAALAGLLRRREARIVLTGSAEEAALTAEIAAALDEPPIDLAGRTTLRSLLGIIGEAALFVTNDTGPMHLANALRVPVVAIFGPTEPRATAPFHPPATVLKKDAPCGPCLYRTCPFDHRCLRSISAEEAFQACLAYLE
ncbi:MAG: lipopolysaccharide heptosyltransferase II [Acidobacteriota bacterium]|nr:lipopolysaccharide heptosyltransferase II [Acidobacteriota bacterium]